MLSDNNPISLQMKDAEVIYYPSFFNISEANQYYNTLLKNVDWQQDEITLFGKTHLQPRLTALFADNNKTYSYSGITMHPHPFNKTLLEIKLKIETESAHLFTTCLCNLYRNGQDSNGWHADNEKELGPDPIIASVSFGAERIFHFKHKENPELKQKLVLKHGSLLLMKKGTQTHWLHQLPKTKKDIGKRINLTFRTIIK
ncbi:alpha-ketoglutarate-dependent dioxygenase AlkB family protein [Formosa haliotis]|uniref:alpha-ketoglutarate-dependent dioxygenase AlkB family protein n=1 Tax=Formosa haliotis TaxID=1555194 RepID=UPI000825294E|nr:alpha-ketoglutarate-dependent dioxygenase AlkB [Formosa haliotis]